MKIVELLNKLTTKTQEDQIKWDSLAQGTFRSIFDNGAITITRINGNDYEIKLYDEDACFASYSTLFDTSLHEPASSLYDAIISSIHRGIERRIDEVFGNELNEQC